MNHRIGVGRRPEGSSENTQCRPNPGLRWFHRRAESRGALDRICRFRHVGRLGGLEGVRGRDAGDHIRIGTVAGTGPPRPEGHASETQGDMENRVIKGVEKGMAMILTFFSWIGMILGTLVLVLLVVPLRIRINGRVGDQEGFGYEWGGDWALGVIGVEKIAGHPVRLSVLGLRVLHFSGSRQEKKKFEAGLAQCETFSFNTDDVRHFAKYGYDKIKATVGAKGVITFNNQTYYVAVGAQHFSRHKSTKVYISDLGDKLFIFEHKENGILLGEALRREPYEKPTKQVAAEPNAVELIGAFLQEKKMAVDRPRLIDIHLRGLNYEAVATYRRTPYHLKLIRNLTDYYIVIDEANDIDKRVWPYLKRIMDAHVPIVRNFLTRVKKKMQALSVGRHVRSTTEGFELRETIDPYNSHFEAEKCDIDANNTWFWNINNKIPVC
jgi:hypothetical protein